VTTGAPNVMLGTKWPSMISMCSHKAPLSIVSAQALPRAAKSADSMDGAIMGGGGIFEDPLHRNDGRLTDCSTEPEFLAKDRSVIGPELSIRYGEVSPRSLSWLGA